LCRLINLATDGSLMQRSDSFLHLLYLYLWPFWLFRDANRGTMLERAAAYRHNRERRIYLPGYAFKWAVLTAFQGGLVVGCEHAARAMHKTLLWVAAAFGTTASVSVTVIAVCLAAWAYLTLVEG
jgi:hypothetical protein